MELEEAASHLRERLAKFFAEEIPTVENALLPIITELEREFPTS